MSPCCTVFFINKDRKEMHSSVIYFGQCSKGNFTSSHFKLNMVGVMAAVTSVGLSEGLAKHLVLTTAWKNLDIRG